MDPPAKTMKPQFGFHYKDPKFTLEGEPYENLPNEEGKKRLTKS